MERPHRNNAESNKSESIDTRAELSEYSIRENYFSHVNDHKWEKIKEASQELLQEMTEMNYFSYGRNSVSAEKSGYIWNELVLAPKDEDHKEKLIAILDEMNIIPWEEVDENVEILIVEHTRDISLLREFLVFDAIDKVIDEAQRQFEIKKYAELLRRQQQEYAERERRVMSYERGVDDPLSEEENELRIKITGDQYRAAKEQERLTYIKELFMSLPISADEPVETSPRKRDPMFQFGYPKSTKSIRSKKERLSKQDLFDMSMLEEVGYENLTDLMEKHEVFFRQGLINETETFEELIAEQKKIYKSKTPSLALFKQKYRWDPGRKLTENIETGETISEEKIAKLVSNYSELTPEQKSKAFTELSLIYRNLILYVLRNIHDRNKTADIDDMFSAGLMGLHRAAELATSHDEEGNKRANFRGYAMLNVESRARRQIQQSRFSPMRIPADKYYDRGKYFGIKKELESEIPHTAIDDRLMEKALREEDVLPENKSYHAFINELFLSFERVSESEIDVFKNQYDTEVTPLGEDRYDSITYDENKDLNQKFTEVFAMLSPREERILRARVGMNSEPGAMDSAVLAINQRLSTQHTAESLARTLREYRSEYGELVDIKNTDAPIDVKELVQEYIEQLSQYNDEKTLEDLGDKYGVTRERIRQIEAKAMRLLKHPSRARKLRGFLDQ